MLSVIHIQRFAPRFSIVVAHPLTLTHTERERTELLMATAFARTDKPD